MIRNRASPAASYSSSNHNGMDVALLLAEGGGNSSSPPAVARTLPARTNSDKYYHPPPRRGSGGMSVWVIVVVTCCCCLGVAVVVGGMGFMVASGMIHFNVDFSNIHIHTGAGGTTGGTTGTGSSDTNSNPQEKKPLLTEEERKQQLVEMAKKIAQDHHEKDQVMLQQAQVEQEQHNVQANPSLAKKSQGLTNNNKNIPQQQQQPAKPGEKQVVRDKDGDIVTDDMLAKDIIDGHQVDVVHTDEEETDLLDGENRWDNSEKIPQWLKDYFVWHNQVVPTLIKSKGDPLDWRSQRYVVMTCLGGEVCGNVAHRLRPLMALLRVAADSKRIFFIHWDLPDRLEKFLQPHQKGGINWVVPEFMMWKVRKSPHQNDMAIIHQQAFQEDRRVVNCMYNDDTFAEQYYNERRLEGEATAAEAFREVWNVLFKPTYLLQERLEESLRLMGLEAGEYASAHIDYEVVPRDEEEKAALRQKVENAMNCMSNLRPGGPFLVAAQTYAIAREAIVYAKHHGVKVHAKQIAHDTSVVPKDLYTSFVEILLMASSRCVAYNKGGYGQLGYMLGYDYDCKIKYTEPTTCEWKDAQVGV